MERMIWRCFGVLLLLSAGSLCSSAAQQPASPPPAVSTPIAPDPLAVGGAAIQRGDYAGAKTIFTQYLTHSPNDMEARFYLGGADLGLKDFPAAVKEFQIVIAAKPDTWAAHQNLALAYAEMQDWANFDQERAVIKAARDSSAPGLDTIKGDLIDVLQVGIKTYRVLAFYTLTGRYHARYAFVHFSDDGKLTDYIQCESDDIDQSSFQQKHPKEAAAGDRSFSLDTYSVTSQGMSQGLIKFYWDEEPPYETVRADALKSLEAQVATPPAAPAPK